VPARYFIVFVWCILILGFTIVVDYFAGILLENAKGPKRKLWLIASIIANTGVLAVFKYYNFLNENLTVLLKGFTIENPIPYLSILLPIGLSFHTFQAMSYTIEVYRHKQKAERNLEYMHCTLCFPAAGCRTN
jgi:D-alanyl-lipoteichoic acid acyltransferase DltB (MBOAT superfamily)